ncbi:MAG TPA: hypothetical protein VIU61_29590 [Kofleriaceae bacterium]
MRLLPSVALVTLAACSDPPPTSLLIVDEEVALGQVFCGSAGSGSVTIVNTGETEADVAIAPTLPRVTVSPELATIAPGEHQTFDVVVKMPELGTPGFISKGDLRVTTVVLEYRVPLTYETAGVSVTLNSPRIVDFGELRPSSYSTSYASLFATSAGVPTTGVGVSVGYAPPSFDVTVSGTFIGIILAGGPNVRRHEATLGVTITGDHLCTPRQLSLDLLGVVSNEPVLASKTVLDLGDIGACDLASADADLENYGPTSTFTATLDDPSGWLEFWGTPGGNLDGAKLAVGTDSDRPRPPQGPFEASATISYATGSKTIPIRGFVRSHTATPLSRELDLGDVPAGKTVLRKITLRNSGNSVAGAQLTSLNATVTPQAVQIEPEGTREGWVSYTAKNSPGTAIEGNVDILFPACRGMERITLRGRIVE